jgi:hypothetical protein
MSFSISTLPIPNLHEVFGENDPARRRAAIDEIWTEDGVFYDPSSGVHHGRDEIDHIAGAIKADTRMPAVNLPTTLHQFERDFGYAGNYATSTGRTKIA